MLASSVLKYLLPCSLVTMSSMLFMGKCSLLIALFRLDGSIQILTAFLVFLQQPYRLPTVLVLSLSLGFQFLPFSLIRLSLCLAVLMEQTLVGVQLDARLHPLGCRILQEYNLLPPQTHLNM